MNRFAPLLLGLLVAGTAAAQTTHTVILDAMSFNPADLTIEQGDTVLWNNTVGIHNVNGTLASYPSNPEGFGNDIAPAPWQYTFTFNTPGVYDYHCDAHGAPGFGMTGRVTVLPAGGCDLELVAADLSYDAGTRMLTVAVTVRNNGAGPLAARLELDYNRNGGAPQGTRVLGSGTLPGGAQASRTILVRVPANAPAGNYNFTLRLVDVASGADCGSYAETLAISAPRLAGDEGDAAFEVEALADLTPSAPQAGSATSAVVSGSMLSASPNPARGQAAIRFTLPEAAAVRLAVYDALGREVAVLLDGHAEAGAHAAALDASALPPGVYVVRLTAGGQTEAGRLTVVR